MLQMVTNPPQCHILKCGLIICDMFRFVFAAILYAF